ncbi:MAG: type II toxin-antitoxin system HicA family toxin [Algisphaera sp.]
MSRKHAKTIARIFENPAPANIKWADIERAVVGLGVEVTEGSGSRVRFAFNGVRSVLHRPHPSPTATRPQVRSVRTFLKNAGVKP